LELIDWAGHYFAAETDFPTGCSMARIRVSPGEMGLTDMIAAIDEAIRTSQTVRIAR
jgi:hypothetical protein